MLFTTPKQSIPEAFSTECSFLSINTQHNRFKQVVSIRTRKCARRVQPLSKRETKEDHTPCNLVHNSTAPL